MGNEREVKPNTQKYSREVVMPQEVSERYKKYCEITKIKLSEPLRIMILESIPQLHNAENLDKIIKKTQDRNLYAASTDRYVRYAVRLPDEAVSEINTYCKFFKLQHRRCHFLYFLIEERLLQQIEGVLSNG